MKIKNYLTKKNIIICSIIFVLIIIVGVLFYIKNNTLIFKNDEQIQNDLARIQEDIGQDSDTKIEDNVYKDYVGVSNGTLYIKDNASDKLKEAAKNNTNIKYEKIVKSDGDILVIDPKEGTNAVNCKIINNTKDIVKLTAFTADNLYEYKYELGSIKDLKVVEAGEDGLDFNIIAPNTTYTICNMFGKGKNTIFFFDKDFKYISSTNENVFKTPDNAYYIKVITDLEDATMDGFYIEYCLVLGEKAGDSFGLVKKTEITINVSEQNDVYFPMEGNQLVVYVDGGQIELSYVQN